MSLTVLGKDGAERVQKNTRRNKVKMDKADKPGNRGMLRNGIIVEGNKIQTVKTIQEVDKELRWVCEAT